MKLTNSLLQFYVFALIFDVVFVNGNNLNNGNVVFIMADDLGWNDVSFHGSDQIPTPNIDALAKSGVALHRYYSHCVCTPSRAALLTGKFAYKTGMQDNPSSNGEERGLPLSEKILPEYLKDNGYKTHLVGKWHLGQHSEEYLPTNRGYDTYFGNKGGFIDYYEYTLEETWNIGKVSGMDLTRNLTADWNAEGYITDLYRNEAISIINSHNTNYPLFLHIAFTAPHAGNAGALLQAPPEDVRAMRHIESPQRQIYAAMVKKIDESIGDIVKSLHDKGMLDNTIIVFVSDNGGPTVDKTKNWSSNIPLRGQKFTAFEGGIRVVGTVWSPQLTNGNQNTWEGYIHVVDWLPTLLGAVGIDPPQEIDGVNQWDQILNNKESKRDEIFEINEELSAIAMIKGRFKLVVSNATGMPDYLDYYGEDLKGVINDSPSLSESLVNSQVFKLLLKNNFTTFNTMMETNNFLIECANLSEERCDPFQDKVCLYNIIEDPCEQIDISEKHPDVVESMKARLSEERAKVVPRREKYHDPRANPINHNYTWSPWM